MEAERKGNAMEGFGEKMMMGGKESRRIDSLGWITESSVMPKKQRAINGVGAASILALQAELYRTQEDIKKFKEGGIGELDAQRSRKRLAVQGGDVFSRKNSGVDERAGRDKLHLKTENDGSASYTALEKKAELYDKLARGEVEEGDDEKYNVLFYKKGTLEAEFQEMESERRGETSTSTTASEYPDKTPLVTPQISSGGRSSSANPGSFVGLSQEQKVLIKEVNEETKQERQKASTLKEKRQEAAAKKREDLRNAYIKKKLEEMKAAAASRDAAQQQLQSSEDTSSSPVAVVADGSKA